MPFFLSLSLNKVFPQRSMPKQILRLSLNIPQKCAMFWRDSLFLTFFQFFFFSSPVRFLSAAVSWGWGFSTVGVKIAEILKRIILRSYPSFSLVYEEV